MYLFVQVFDLFVVIFLSLDSYLRASHHKYNTIPGELHTKQAYYFIKPYMSSSSCDANILVYKLYTWVITIFWKEPCKNKC